MRLQQMQQRQLFGELLKVNDVAHLLRVHPNSVRRWADQGLLPVYRIGFRGDRRFNPDDVANFLESRLIPSEPSATKGV